MLDFTSQAEMPTGIDPATLPETYAMRVTGDCMEPEVADGAALVFSRDAQIPCGGLCALFWRPEAIEPGTAPIWLKHVVLSVGKGYWRDPGAYDGNIAPVVLFQQINPFRRWGLRPEALLAVHKCLGTAEDLGVTVTLARRAVA